MAPPGVTLDVVTARCPDAESGALGAPDAHIDKPTTIIIRVNATSDRSAQQFPGHKSKKNPTTINTGNIHNQQKGNNMADYFTNFSVVLTA